MMVIKVKYIIEGFEKIGRIEEVSFKEYNINYLNEVLANIYKTNSNTITISKIEIFNYYN